MDRIRNRPFVNVVSANPSPFAINEPYEIIQNVGNKDLAVFMNKPAIKSFEMFIEWSKNNLIPRREEYER